MANTYTQICLVDFNNIYYLFLKLQLRHTHKTQIIQHRLHCIRMRKKNRRTGIRTQCVFAFAPVNCSRRRLSSRAQIDSCPQTNGFCRSLCSASIHRRLSNAESATLNALRGVKIATALSEFLIFGLIFVRSLCGIVFVFSNESKSILINRLRKARAKPESFFFSLSP